ncbi:MAG: GldG family protein, partial [Deltaproteobacteria bacterium]|nr:GldG family protein [Deltaproteobacteria bacterium]
MKERSSDIEHRTSKKRARWIILTAVIIGIFTLNLLASRHFARLDLTRQKIYTLSPATRELLQNLNDVVVFRLYFTPDLPPALKPLRNEVEDMLKEFKTYAGNHLKVEYHNPQENGMTEQKVQMMGIPPIEVNVIERDKQAAAKIYLGMTVNFESRQEVLAVVQNTSNLEYRLDAAILKVTEAKKGVIGWWGPAVQGDQAFTPQQSQGGYDMALERLKQRYDVRSVLESGLDKLDPTEIPTLLFVVPNKMTEEEKQAFTNYLDKGGKAIVLVERVNVALGQGLKPEPQENPIEDILKTYGVEVKQDMVLDKSNAMATFTGGVVSYHIPYPYWVMIRPENFNHEQPMVSELAQLVLPWPASISLTDTLPEGATATTLFHTTRFGVSGPINPMLSLDPQTANNAMTAGKPEA